MRTLLATLFLLALTLSGSAQSRFTRYVTNVTDLVAINPNGNDNLYVLLGRNTANDGGGGPVLWTPGSASSTNLGTVFKSVNSLAPAGRFLRQYSESPNVRWFGATGNGTTDDTAAFQAALNLAQGIFIPDGTYVISELDVPNGSLVLGQSFNAVLKKKAASVTYVLGSTTVSTYENITIKNLTIDGNKANTSAGGGIALAGLNIEVNNVYIHDTPDAGVNFGYRASGGNNRVLNSFFLNCGKVGNNYGAIAVTGGPGITIAGNQILCNDGGQHYGIDIEPNVGVPPADAGNVSIYGNIIKGGTLQVDFANLAAPATNIVISHNLVDVRGAHDTGSDNIAPFFHRNYRNFIFSDNISYAHDTATDPFQGIYFWNLFNGTVANNSFFGRDVGGGVNERVLYFDASHPSSDVALLFNRIGSYNGTITFGINAVAGSSTNLLLRGNIPDANVVTLQEVSGSSVHDWATDLEFTNLWARAFWATNANVLQLLHAGTQTNGDGLVVGSQSASMSGFGNGVGMEIYSNGNTSRAALTSLNTETNTSAGLKNQWVLYNTSGSGVRASQLETRKLNTFTPGTEQSYVTLSALTNGSTLALWDARPDGFYSYAPLLAGPLKYGLNGTTNTVWLLSGNGTPEGSVTAAPGSLYANFGGGSTTTLYVKESGAGNTGWAAAGGGGSGATNAYNQIQVNGTNVSPTRSTLNLVGTGLSGGDTSSVTTVYFPLATGTVSSVALTMPSGFSVGGSPVTSSGTLAVSISGGATDTFYRGDGAWSSTLLHQSADTIGPLIVLEKRGTTGNANNPPVANDILGTIDFFGWDGSSYGPGSAIQTLATETFSGSAHGSKLQFYTTPNGSTTATAWGTFQNYGAFNLTPQAAPTTSAAGDLAFDNNAWAASRGTLQLFDGTASTYVVSALASDTPSNGQVPTWNTGGTITWESPAAGFTTGAGVTNISTVLSANLAAGANITFTTNSNGQIEIASSGGGGTTNGIAGFQAIGSGTDYAFADAPNFEHITFGTSGPDFVLTNAGVYQIIMEVGAAANSTFPQYYLLTNVTDSVLLPGSFITVDTPADLTPRPITVQYTTTGANRTIQLFGASDDLTYMGSPSVISTNTILNVLYLGNPTGAGSDNWTASGTTNSTLTGNFFVNGGTVTNSLTINGALTGGGTNVWGALAGKQTAFTTGLGITNVANVLSNNIAAGANVTITAGSNGQLTIASSGSGGSAPTNTLVSLSTPSTSGGLWYASDAIGTNATASSTWTITTSTNLTGNGLFSDSANGAASLPPVSLTGTWFSGGSATTTKPQLLIEPSGTTSTAWSTAGTGIGANAASGFTGNLIDLQLAAASKFSVTSAGTVTAAGNLTAANIFGSDIRAGSANLLYWNSRSLMNSPADGQIQFRNNGANTFTGLILGADDASPNATPIYVRAGNGVGTDINGEILALDGGGSTGTGAGGDATMRTTFSARSTGSSANTRVDRFRVVAKGKVLNDASAVSLFEVALPTLKGCGGVIQATIECTDGTDLQRFTQTIRFASVNKGGTYTDSIQVTDAASEPKVVTGGSTLTAAWTILDGTNKITIQINADTSLTPSSNAFVVYYTITNNSEQAITVL